MRGEILAELSRRYPHACLVGCSSAGQIYGPRVLDEGVVATAIRFEGSQFRLSEVSIAGPDDSLEAGRALASSLPHDGLVHAFVLSDGLYVNGTRLVDGIRAQLPPGVAVTGGLAGDDARFAETYVLTERGAAQRKIAMLGFYGEHLKVGYGSMGGWDPFGPERRITRSNGNVLYELDGQNALELYKLYLGQHASELPSSGLLFPLTLRAGEGQEPIVRTILAVNEAEQSMTFAGDMPEGSISRLMRANFNRVIDGASGAARDSRIRLGDRDATLAILVSCVGRKLMLKQRVEDEVDGVIDVLGRDTRIAGFYSYGEICPSTPEASCALHNQTMTITTFAES